MIEFLKKCNVSDKVINTIEKANSKANLYNLNCNQDEVIKIINYLNSIGVYCINDLLIYRIEKFFVSYIDFKSMFENKGVNNFVVLLNNDYLVIDEL